MIDGYFKINSTNTTQRGGELFPFDTRDTAGLRAVWERVSARAKALDDERGRSIFARKAMISYWGNLPSYGPWNGVAIPIGEVPAGLVPANLSEA